MVQAHAWLYYLIFYTSFPREGHITRDKHEPKTTWLLRGIVRVYHCTLRLPRAPDICQNIAPGTRLVVHHNRHAERR